VAVLAWIYGAERFIGDINSMLRWPVNSLRYTIFYNYWRTMWRFVTPIICISILIATFVTHKPNSYDGKAFPTWANLAGWAVSFVSVSCIPMVATYQLAKAPGYSVMDRLRGLLRPTQEWGPRNPQERMASENRWREQGHRPTAASTSGVTYVVNGNVQEANGAGMTAFTS